MLLPIPGLSLSARFSGAYCIQVLSDTDYVVQTPDRRRKTRVCHINMLKPYHSRAVSPTVETSGCAAAAVVTPVRHEAGDGLTTRPSSLTARLPNSAMIKLLPESLAHLHTQMRRTCL